MLHRRKKDQSQFTKWTRGNDCNTEEWLFKLIAKCQWLWIRIKLSNKHFFVASRKAQARLAQSVEHETLNLRVVGSSPTLGDSFPSFRIYVVAIFYMLWHPRKYSLHLSPDTWPSINWRCKKAIAYKTIFPLKKEATLLLTTVMRSSTAALTPCANVVGAPCPLTEHSSNMANSPYNFAKTIRLR